MFICLIVIFQVTIFRHLTDIGLRLQWRLAISHQLFQPSSMLFSTKIFSLLHRSFIQISMYVFNTEYVSFSGIKIVTCKSSFLFVDVHNHKFVPEGFTEGLSRKQHHLSLNVQCRAWNYLRMHVKIVMGCIIKLIASLVGGWYIYVIPLN